MRNKSFSILRAYKKYALKCMEFTPCGRKKPAGCAFLGNFFAVANFAMAKKLQIGVVRVNNGRCILLKKAWAPLTIAQAKKLIDGDPWAFCAHGVAEYLILDVFSDNKSEYTYAALMYY